MVATRVRKFWKKNKQPLILAALNEENKMEMIIHDGQELDAKVVVADGKLAIISAYEGKMGGIKAEASVSLEAVIDALEAAIPGDWDKIPANMLKASLKLV